MTATKAAKPRRASARRTAEAAPQDMAQRMDRLETMFAKVMDHLSGTAPNPEPEMEPVHQPRTDYADDDKEDPNIVRAENERMKRDARQADEIAHQVMTGLLDPKDVQILEWLMAIQGKSAGQILKEILRSAIVKERPAFREAHGGGGSSSRDLGSLSERLPRR